jgi:hypothetical protein
MKDGSYLKSLFSCRWPLPLSTQDSLGFLGIKASMCQIFSSKWFCLFANLVVNTMKMLISIQFAFILIETLTQVFCKESPWVAIINENQVSLSILIDLRPIKISQKIFIIRSAQLCKCLGGVLIKSTVRLVHSRLTFKIHDQERISLLKKLSNIFDLNFKLFYEHFQTSNNLVAVIF